MTNDRFEVLQDNYVAGNVDKELDNASLEKINGAGADDVARKSSGDICTLTSECDHLATWVCC